MVHCMANKQTICNTKILNCFASEMIAGKGEQTHVSRGIICRYEIKKYITRVYLIKKSQIEILVYSIDRSPSLVNLLI